MTPFFLVFVGQQRATASKRSLTPSPVSALVSKTRSFGTPRVSASAITSSREDSLAYAWELTKSTVGKSLKQWSQKVGCSLACHCEFQLNKRFVPMIKTMQSLSLACNSSVHFLTFSSETLSVRSFVCWICEDTIRRKGGLWCELSLSASSDVVRVFPQTVASKSNVRTPVVRAGLWVKALCPCGVPKANHNFLVVNSYAFFTIWCTDRLYVLSHSYHFFVICMWRWNQIMQTSGVSLAK